jgi:hypothetical protein
MQKVLLSAILALFMALALFGMKLEVSGSARSNGTVLVADGGSQLPPPPCTLDGGSQLPPPPPR